MIDKEDYTFIKNEFHWALNHMLESPTNLHWNNEGEKRDGVNRVQKRQEEILEKLRKLLELQ